MRSNNRDIELYMKGKKDGKEELQQENKQLQERIDKAIQLLNKHSIDCFEKWYDNNDFSKIMNIILEILKGEE